MIGFISLNKLTSVDEAFPKDGWILSMQEKLNQLMRNDVWDIGPRPNYRNIIRKRIFWNKLNEQGDMVRNKTRLVAQGYNQQEGIYFSETFALVARLEEIRLIISYFINHDIILYQMNVKSVFLNGVISEEVHVKQPLGFKDSIHPKFVFILKKSLYGLQ